jgi:hypothetical protein
MGNSVRSSATRDDRAVSRTPLGYTQMMARRLLITTSRRATLMKPVSRSFMLTISSLSLLRLNMGGGVVN